jgi:hypothetical protein
MITSPRVKSLEERQADGAKAAQLWALSQSTDADGFPVASPPAPASSAPADPATAAGEAPPADTSKHIDPAQGAMPDAIVLGGDPVALAEAEGDYVKARGLKAQQALNARP